jgi:hypothetical protein
MKIEKLKQEILELFCGVGNGEIDCTSEAEIKLNEIIVEFMKDKECDMCGWGEYDACIRCGQPNN